MGVTVGVDLVGRGFVGVGGVVIGGKRLSDVDGAGVGVRLGVGREVDGDGVGEDDDGVVGAVDGDGLGALDVEGAGTSCSLKISCVEAIDCWG